MPEAAKSIRQHLNSRSQSRARLHRATTCVLAQFKQHWAVSPVQALSVHFSSYQSLAALHATSCCSSSCSRTALSAHSTTTGLDHSIQSSTAAAVVHLLTGRSTATAQRGTSLARCSRQRHSPDQQSSFWPAAVAERLTSAAFSTGMQGQQQQREQHLNTPVAQSRDEQCAGSLREQPIQDVQGNASRNVPIYDEPMQPPAATATNSVDSALRQQQQHGKNNNPTAQQSRVDQHHQASLTSHPPPAGIAAAAVVAATPVDLSAVHQPASDSLSLYNAAAIQLLPSAVSGTDLGPKEPAAAAAAAAGKPESHVLQSRADNGVQHSNAISEVTRLEQGTTLEASDSSIQQQYKQTADGKHPHKEDRKQTAPKPGPTHFIALQVSHSTQVVESITAVQQKLLETDKHLKPCCLEPVTAHLTIMVLQLNDQASHEAAEVALAGLLPVLQQQQLCAPLQLHLKGLSHFRHQVLYLDVAPGPGRASLTALGAAVTAHFSAADGGRLLVPGETKAFTPHVTIAKTSRMIGRHKKGGRKGRVKIPDEAWQQFVDVDGGQVVIDEIQICSMQGRRAGQYYRVTHRLRLTPPGEAVEVQTNKPGRLAAARQRFTRLLSRLLPQCRRSKRRRREQEEEMVEPTM